MTRLMLTLMLMLVWPLGSEAGGFYDGQSLRQDCTDTGTGERRSNMLKHLVCNRYLAGVADAINAFSADRGQAGGKGYSSCIPDGASLEQLRQVWLSYAKKHRNDLGQSAASLALLAFGEAWPCPK